MVSARPVGTTGDGEAVECWTLQHGSVEAEVLTYGARLHAVRTPDRRGDLANVISGPSDLGGHLAGEIPYAGAIVGRWANRLGNGEVVVGGRTYHLAANEGTNTLHGGPDSIDGRVWTAEPVPDATGPGVRLYLTSPAGDNGFPARLEIAVTYRLTSAATLVIEIEATADAPTVVNLTTHAYWNLGADAGIGGHTLQVHADRVVAVDDALLPVAVEAVDHTPFDLRRGALLSEVLERVDLDHCYLLTGNPAAVLTDPASGRRLTMRTDQPGIQVYLGGKLPTSHAALALEPEIAPDAPNRPDLDLGPRGLPARHHDRVRHGLMAASRSSPQLRDRSRAAAGYGRRS